MPPFGGVSGHTQTQNSMKGLNIFSVLGMPWGLLGGAEESHWGEECLGSSSGFLKMTGEIKMYITAAIMTFVYLFI